jgi:hypothetical protein
VELSSYQGGVRLIREGVLQARLHLLRYGGGNILCLSLGILLAAIRDPETIRFSSLRLPFGTTSSQFSTSVQFDT